MRSENELFIFFAIPRDELLNLHLRRLEHVFVEEGQHVVRRMRKRLEQRLKDHFGNAVVFELAQHLYHALERLGALRLDRKENSGSPVVVRVKDLERQGLICLGHCPILLLVEVLLLDDVNHV